MCFCWTLIVKAIYYAEIEKFVLWKGKLCKSDKYIPNKILIYLYQKLILFSNIKYYKALYYLYHNRAILEDCV